MYARVRSNGIAVVAKQESRRAATKRGGGCTMRRLPVDADKPPSANRFYRKAVTEPRAKVRESAQHEPGEDTTSASTLAACRRAIKYSSAQQQHSSYISAHGQCAQHTRH